MCWDSGAAFLPLIARLGPSSTTSRVKTLGPCGVCARGLQRGEKAKPGKAQRVYRLLHMMHTPKRRAGAAAAPSRSKREGRPRPPQTGRFDQPCGKTVPSGNLGPMQREREALLHYLLETPCEMMLLLLCRARPSASSLMACCELPRPEPPKSQHHQHLRRQHLCRCSLCVSWRWRCRVRAWHGAVEPAVNARLGERAWLPDPHATGNCPSHWLPASRLRSWSPSKQLGSVPREFPTRSNRGRDIGFPWPIVPQLYLLNEGA